MGAILAQSLTVTSPNSETHTISWGKGNVTSTDSFTARKASGKWIVFMTGTNIAPSYLGDKFVGGIRYSSVQMTIKYVLE